MCDQLNPIQYEHAPLRVRCAIQLKAVLKKVKG